MHGPAGTIDVQYGTGAEVIFFSPQRPPLASANDSELGQPFLLVRESLSLMLSPCVSYVFVFSVGFVTRVSSECLSIYLPKGDQTAQMLRMTVISRRFSVSARSTLRFKRLEKDTRFLK